MGSRAVLYSFVGMCLIAACGGDSTDDSIPAEAVVTTTTAAADTTSTTAETTTTTAPETTTTTVAGIDASVVTDTFRAYFDLVVARDYEEARAMSSGSASHYASFTEHFNLISPQPDWRFESAPEGVTGQAIALDDGRYGVEGTLLYTEPNGGRLEVSNPVVLVADGATTLDEWGVDLGSGVDQPSLSQRLKLLGFSAIPDASSCYDGGMWAYVPGGVPIDIQLRIITIGLACSQNGDLIPQLANIRIYSEDGSVEAPPTNFIMQGGGDRIPANTPSYHLAIFELPPDAASTNLFWETPFDRSDVPATTFHNWEIGPFDLG